MASGITKLEEESHKEVLDKPGGSYGAIIENGTALYLYEAGTVVKMAADSPAGSRTENQKIRLYSTPL